MRQVLWRFDAYVVKFFLTLPEFYKVLQTLFETGKSGRCGCFQERPFAFFLLVFWRAYVGFICIDESEAAFVAAAVDKEEKRFCNNPERLFNLIFFLKGVKLKTRVYYIQGVLSWNFTTK